MPEEHRSFAEVLKEAQEKGYAEADPTFDIGGFDTAHKLALLTSLAFGTDVAFDQITSRASSPSPRPTSRRPRTRLPHQAARRRRRARRAASSRACTRPWCRSNRRIAEVVGRHQLRRPSTAISSATCCLSGPGAGARPTASAVASDILDIARGARDAAASSRPTRSLEALQARQGRRAPGRLLRAPVGLRPARAPWRPLPSAWATQNVSLESIVQRRMPRSVMPAPAVTPARRAATGSHGNCHS